MKAIRLETFRHTFKIPYILYIYEHAKARTLLKSTSMQFPSDTSGIFITFASRNVGCADRGQIFWSYSCVILFARRTCLHYPGIPRYNDRRNFVIIIHNVSKALSSLFHPPSNAHWTINTIIISARIHTKCTLPTPFPPHDADGIARALARLGLMQHSFCELVYIA